VQKHLLNKLKQNDQLHIHFVSVVVSSISEQKFHYFCKCLLKHNELNFSTVSTEEFKNPEEHHHVTKVFFEKSIAFDRVAPVFELTYIIISQKTA
jgi:hypothetical protein